ncbi:MAG: hypothetical protein KAR13_12790 [Desulfobulbaceae bacterium]|nr:hypothetical protein [Desulfobulbaceae bacterium]
MLGLQPLTRLPRLRSQPVFINHQSPQTPFLDFGGTGKQGTSFVLPTLKKYRDIKRLKPMITWVLAFFLVAFSLCLACFDSEWHCFAKNCLLPKNCSGHASLAMTGKV